MIINLSRFQALYVSGLGPNDSLAFLVFVKSELKADVA